LCLPALAIGDSPIATKGTPPIVKVVHAPIYKSELIVTIRVSIKVAKTRRYLIAKSTKKKEKN
jgi:hypothetical protein